MCRVSDSTSFNLLQKSLTSPAALQALKRLPETDPTFWRTLIKNEATAPYVKHPSYDGAEDDDPNEENSTLKYDDDHFCHRRYGRLNTRLLFGGIGLLLQADAITVVRLVLLAVAER
jgi:hypothetical protein